MSVWQPIETAPKDRSILAYWPERRGYADRQDVVVVHWTAWGGGVWETLSGGGKLDNRDLTHWMPLPEAPETAPVTATAR